MKPYPQMPPFTQDEIEAFLKEAPIARLSSLNPDGTIHIAPVYFKYDNGNILIGTQDMTHKVRNIKNNQQVTVLIDNQTPLGRAFLSMERRNSITKMWSQNAPQSLNATCQLKMLKNLRRIWPTTTIQSSFVSRQTILFLTTIPSRVLCTT